MVHGAQTLQTSSARLTLRLAAAYDFEVRASDIKLPYLQSTKRLERRVFINNPAPEFELDPSECFELCETSMVYAMLVTFGMNPQQAPDGRIEIGANSNRHFSLLFVSK